MIKLYGTYLNTESGPKQIAVYQCDVLDFPEPIDILTTSAFHRSYHPTPRTLFHALYQRKIDVESLAQWPAIDLRQLCNVWLSQAVDSPFAKIRRVGCIELHQMNWDGSANTSFEKELLNSLKAYFQMLDIAATYGIPMDTIALPLLGAGRQHISANLTMIPIINECIAFLKRNQSVKRIYFIERDGAKAELIARTLAGSYLVTRERNAVSTPAPTARASQPFAFISYSSPDKNIADNLCAKLEKEGVKVWYAPRNVRGDYATAIAEAISQSTHFIVILSKNSMGSQHVLNEIDLAFQSLPKIKFKPLRIDDTGFAPAFNYYLSRQHWMDANVPPLEERLQEYVTAFMSDL